MTADERWAEGPGLLESMWRYRYAVAIAALVGGLLGWLVSSAQDPVYAAVSRVFLLDPSDPGLLEINARNTDMERYTLQQAERMTSRPVLEAAAGALPNSPSPEGLARAVEAEPDVELEAVEVSASSGQPERAAAIANAVVAAYEDLAAQDTQREAEAAISVIEEQIAELQEQLENVGTDPTDLVEASRARTLTEQILALDSQASEIAARAAILGSGVDVVEDAGVPEAPVAPSPARDAVLAAILLGGLAAAAAYWRSGRVADHAVTSSDPASVLGVPLLGEVPRYRTSGRRTLADGLRLSPAAVEAYQFVLSSMQFALAEIDGRTVLVTSASPGEGKTVSALQLAAASVRDGRRTTLVDADIRARGLTGMLQADATPGLSDVLRGSTSLEAALKRYRVDDDLVLPVLTSGTQNADPASLLRGPATAAVARELASSSELVIYDTPPLPTVVDTTIVASHVDGIVLVVSSGASLSSLRRLKERLAFVSTPLLGYVFNRGEDEAAAGAYGYGYQPTSQTDGRGSVLSRVDPPVRERLGTGARTRRSQKENR